MLMLSIIFVIVRGLLEWNRICAGFSRLFIHVYVLALEIQLSSGNPLTEIIPQYVVPVPSQDLDFQRQIFFLCLLLGTYTNMREV